MEVRTPPTRRRRESSTTPQGRGPQHHEGRPTTTHGRKEARSRRPKRRNFDPSFILFWNSVADLRFSCWMTLPLPVSCSSPLEVGMEQSNSTEGGEGMPTPRLKEGRATSHRRPNPTPRSKEKEGQRTGDKEGRSEGQPKKGRQNNPKRESERLTGNPNSKETHNQHFPRKWWNAAPPQRGNVGPGEKVRERTRAEEEWYGQPHPRRAIGRPISSPTWKATATPRRNVSFLLWVVLLVSLSSSSFLGTEDGILC